MCDLGTDPELFVKAGGELLPAFEFLPAKSFALCEGNVRAFWDGFQAEYTTYGHECLSWLVDDVHAGLQLVRQTARQRAPGAELSLANVVEIPEGIRRLAKAQHVELGCDPSINVYGMRGRRVDDPRELPYRVAGGHIHLSLVPYQRREVDELVKTLDAILGVWAVGAARHIDNPIRRQLYGLAGEFRLPKHGLEYRTLSNFWLCHPAIMNLTFEIARTTLEFALTGRRSSWATNDREVVDVINACDVKGAEAILRRNAAMFTNLLNPRFGIEFSNAALQVGLEGVESVVSDPHAIAGNWLLEGDWLMHCEGVNCTWMKAAQKMIWGLKV